MAARFWVTVAGSGTGTWDNSLTLHWSATSGGLGGQSAPGSGDTVTFDANSCPAGETVTVNADVNITSITMGAFTGTLDFSANNNNPTMQTFSNTGTGTRVLNSGSGTWTITGNATTIFTQATSTGLTFTEGGGTINFTYSGSTGTRSIALSAAGLLNTTLKISAGTDTIAFSANNPIVNNLDFTGFSGTYTDARSMTISGNYTLGTGMTASASGSHTFVGTSGIQIMTSNGVTQQYSLVCGTTAVTGTSVQLADALIIDSTHTLSHSKGILNTNNKNVTTGLFSCTTTNTRTLTLGSSLITLTGTGTIWNLATTTGLTFNANTSTIKANDASASTKTFSFGALTYYNLYLTGGGTGVFQLGTTTSSKTFNSIQVDPALTVQVFAGSTLVLSSPTLLISGNGGQLNTFQSTTNGQTWTISSATGTFNENYISLQDSIATGGGTFYAGAQSTNVSGNTGWIFTDAPDQNQNAKRDANMITALLAISSEDGATVIPVYADANTHALFVSPF